MIGKMIVPLGIAVCCFAFAATLQPPKSEPHLSPIQKVAAAAIEYPADEKAFISAIESARENYRNAANDMLKGANRPARARSICAAIPSKTASRWIGQIETLDSNGDGKGILKIKIAPDVFVETYNNSFSDSGSRTLIEPSSPLFAKVSVMKTGQWVSFSGNFFGSDSDCVQEISLTLSGSITSPDFIMRFIDVVAL